MGKVASATFVIVGEVQQRVAGKEFSMEEKKGVVASEGVALGQIYIYKKQEIVIDQKRITEKEQNGELRRVEQAISAYRHELSTLNVETEVQREITEAHQNMLEDPFLIDSIQERIQDGKNAEWALKETVDSMVDMMRALDDPYLKERATDYRDIGERLLYKIKGIVVSDLSKVPENTIVVSEELTPSDTATMKKENIVGFMMDRGGKTAHVSIIAQTLGIPCLVAMGDISSSVENGMCAVIDTDRQLTVLDPDDRTVSMYEKMIVERKEERARLEEHMMEPAVSLDGRHVEVCANIGNIEDLRAALKKGADGVGLFRTEFLYMESDHFPTEEEQFEVYKEAAQLLNGKALIIRTLDIGGDKALSYFDFPQEDNPFLGWRAIRLCFDREDVFKTQLRAILRASHYGKIRILLPMIISVEEILKVKEWIEGIKSDLREEKIPFDDAVEVGIMIETPASVWMAEEMISHVDYFSIGTNDLTQYTLAVDRGNQKITALYNNFHPAVLRSIKHVIDASHAVGKWTGMCGGFAADSHATALLFGLGLDEFSTPPQAIAKVKDRIRHLSYEEQKSVSESIVKKGAVSDIMDAIK